MLLVGIRLRRRCVGLMHAVTPHHLHHHPATATLAIFLVLAGLMALPLMLLVLSGHLPMLLMCRRRGLRERGPGHPDDQQADG
ncbi:MAG TPA: hypothetical protein VFO69_13685 [Allosphingosinicella sp.]|nr:hypothetical protein [Allosphingosinicella sp.]